MASVTTSSSSGGRSSGGGNNSNNNNNGTTPPDLDAIIAAALEAATSASGGNGEIGSMQDDPTMKLTPYEIERATLIKRAVEADHRLTNLSDFEYVHWALTTNPADGSIAEVVCERIFMIQCFKEEYRIHDEIEEGITLFFQMTEEQPGLFLAMNYLPTSQNYISISECAAFYPTKVKTDEEMRIFMGGLFYIYQCQQPNFRAIRNGMSLMLECLDSSFENLDISLMERFMVELWTNYPKNLKEWFFLNSGTVGTMTFSLWKRFLPPEMRNKFILGHQIPGLEGQRLSSLYNTPTPEQGRERMTLNVLQFLALRYQNQQNFRLPDQPEDEDDEEEDEEEEEEEDDPEDEDGDVQGE